ncbi:hypothetical protein [Vibrio mediterranei]|uniref:hypothetical protein n=1 Tax=Vibrio mediterranei TaxID=689 RepID=UPI0040692C84
MLQTRAVDLQNQSQAIERPTISVVTSINFNVTNLLGLETNEFALSDEFPEAALSYRTHEAKWAPIFYVRAIHPIGNDEFKGSVENLKRKLGEVPKGTMLLFGTCQTRAISFKDAVSVIGIWFDGKQWRYLLLCNGQPTLQKQNAPNAVISRSFDELGETELPPMVRIKESQRTPNHLIYHCVMFPHFPPTASFDGLQIEYHITQRPLHQIGGTEWMIFG